MQKCTLSVKKPKIEFVSSFISREVVEFRLMHSFFFDEKINKMPIQLSFLFKKYPWQQNSN